MPGAGRGADFTPDAHLAALAVENRGTISSQDADFARFHGVRWINPCASSTCPQTEDGVMENMSEQQLTSVERTLTSALLAWSAASVAVGATVTVAGRSSASDEVMAFGRQTAAWGAVDALIAGGGVLSRRSRGPLSGDEADKKVRSLRTLLLVNAAADIGYIAGGALLIARGRRGRKTLRMSMGDGAAIAIQGAFLLVLDLSQARQLP